MGVRKRPATPPSLTVQHRKAITGVYRISDAQMPPVENYSPNDRRSAKQVARERDDSDLREGRVSRADMSAHNGAFGSLDIASAVIRRRR